MKRKFALNDMEETNTDSKKIETVRNQKLNGSGCVEDQIVRMSTDLFGKKHPNVAIGKLNSLSKIDQF